MNDVSYSDNVFLKVSPWKKITYFGLKVKLSPTFIGPYEILECIGPIGYQLALPPELSKIHDNLKVEEATWEKESSMKEHHHLSGEGVFIPSFRGLVLFGRLRWLRPPKSHDLDGLRMEVLWQSVRSTSPNPPRLTSLIGEFLVMAGTLSGGKSFYCFSQRNRRRSSVKGKELIKRQWTDDVYDGENKTQDNMFCLRYGTLVQTVIGENLTLQRNIYVLEFKLE
ncbi:Chromo domain-containing protein [Gossypium australe]|uniref:Chromo domain-containing protein n=1 Tax=Gossypium australe TaxID=47621 RepID=A0A5B6W838_9ROSI|nr:Chromo domain-containing protein [Gossypium australe]